MLSNALVVLIVAVFALLVLRIVAKVATRPTRMVILAPKNAFSREVWEQLEEAGFTGIAYSPTAIKPEIIEPPKAG